MGVVPIGSDTYTPGDRTEELQTVELQGYMVGSNNLSELTEVSEARTKLSVYSIAQIDAGFAPIATTLAGYGITDAYTKTETDTQISTAISSLIDGAPATLDTLNELAEALADDDDFAGTMTTALSGKSDTGHTHTFASLTSKPTTISGYGITDAYTKTEVDAKTWDFSSDITGKPTTLAGYGITDGISNVVEDTSPQLGGDLDLNGKYVSLADALGSDHTGEGIYITGTAGETINVGAAIGVASDGDYENCDADVAGDFPCTGIALESKTVGQAIKVLIFGVFRDDTWAFTTGSPVYVGGGGVSHVGGALNTTAPGGASDNVQRVGISLDADTLLFMPSLDVIINA